MVHSMDFVHMKRVDEHETFDEFAYEGDWVDGQPQGEGILFVDDKQVYKGGFQASHYHGNGNYSDPEGTFTYKG